MSYTLQHTAESIDDKLSLINENKNLLPYKYEYTAVELPAALEDVGDGSFLTTLNVEQGESKGIVLTTTKCKLLAGTYTASLSITNAIDGNDIQYDPSGRNGFVLQLFEGTEGGTQHSASQITTESFTLDKETVIIAKLSVPHTFDRGLLIKPQIEKGNTKTDWVPYMDKIGSYVDERFNGTSAKIKALGVKPGVGKDSTVSGIDTQALGEASHAEGFGTSANTDYSHSEGYGIEDEEPDVIKNHAGMRGFSIISSDYSDLSACTLTLDSVEGIEVGYTFYYSALVKSGNVYNAWRPGFIPVEVRAIKGTTITISETLYFSTVTSTKINMEFREGKVVDPDNSEKVLLGINEGGYVPYDNRLACKIYFWEHPNLGTSSVNKGSHSEGRSNMAVGHSSHAQGRETKAIGDYAHTEGKRTQVYAENGHAEGSGSIVAPTIDYAANGHAEGEKTTTRGPAHAEGCSSSPAINKFGSYTVIRNAKTADVLNTWIDSKNGFLMANGIGTHAEGRDTLSNANAAHAEGIKTLANAEATHSEGIGTIAVSPYQHVQGKYNLADVMRNSKGKMLDRRSEVTTILSEAVPADKYAHIVGGGTSDEDRKNIHTLDWNGNAWFAGNAKFDGTVTATTFDGTATNATRLTTGNLAIGPGTQAVNHNRLVVGTYNNTANDTAYFIVGNGTADKPNNIFYVNNKGAYCDGYKVVTAGAGVAYKSRRLAKEDNTNLSVKGPVSFSDGLPVTMTEMTLNKVTAKSFVGNVEGNVTGNVDGNATSADKAKALDLSKAVGSTDTPIYFGSDGKPKECSNIVTETRLTEAINGVVGGRVTYAETAGTADALKNALTIGGKSYDGSSAISVSAADLGIANAIHFIGETTTALADGTTTKAVAIDGASKTPVSGDVVLYGAKEFIWNGSAWKELGDGSSHALKTNTVTAGNGLTGGGQIGNSPTLNIGQGNGITVTADAVAAKAGNGITVDSAGINHADTSSQASVTASGRKYITGVTLDTYGHVTGLTSGTETVTDTNTTYDLAAPANKTNGSVTIDLKAGGSGSGTDSVKIKGSGATTVTTDATGVITISSTVHSAAGSSLGLVKSGADVSISSGLITVNQAAFAEEANKAKKIMIGDSYYSLSLSGNVLIIS